MIIKFLQILLLAGFTLTGFWYGADVAFFKPIATYQGMDLPQEKDLIYKTGYISLNTIEEDDGTHFAQILLHKNPIHQKHQFIYGNYSEFYCGYRPYQNKTADLCPYYQGYYKHHGKYAKIGYYVPKPLFGYTNDSPQLVTLDIENEPFITYQETQKIH